MQVVLWHRKEDNHDQIVKSNSYNILSWVFWYVDISSGLDCLSRLTWW